MIDSHFLSSHRLFVTSVILNLSISVKGSLIYFLLNGGPFGGLTHLLLMFNCLAIV